MKLQQNHKYTPVSKELEIVGINNNNFSSSRPSQYSPQNHDHGRNFRHTDRFLSDILEKCCFQIFSYISVSLKCISSVIVLALTNLSFHLQHNPPNNKKVMSAALLGIVIFSVIIMINLIVVNEKSDRNANETNGFQELDSTERGSRNMQKEWRKTSHRDNFNPSSINDEEMKASGIASSILKQDKSFLVYNERRDNMRKGLANIDRISNYCNPPLNIEENEGAENRPLRSRESRKMGLSLSKLQILIRHGDRSSVHPIPSTDGIPCLTNLEDQTSLNDVLSEESIMWLKKAVNFDQELEIAEDIDENQKAKDEQFSEGNKEKNANIEKWKLYQFIGKYMREKMNFEYLIPLTNTEIEKLSKTNPNFISSSDSNLRTEINVHDNTKYDQVKANLFDATLKTTKSLTAEDKHRFLPKENEMLKDKNCEPGTLTNHGFYQLFLTGNYLSYKYRSFLSRRKISSTMNMDLIRLRSTPYARTVQSLSSFLVGFVPHESYFGASPQKATLSMATIDSEEIMFGVGLHGITSSTRATKMIDEFNRNSDTKSKVIPKSGGCVRGTLDALEQDRTFRVREESQTILKKVYSEDKIWNDPLHDLVDPFLVQYCTLNGEFKSKKQGILDDRNIDETIKSVFLLSEEDIGMIASDADRLYNLHYTGTSSFPNINSKTEESTNTSGKNRSSSLSMLPFLKEIVAKFKLYEKNILTINKDKTIVLDHDKRKNKGSQDKNVDQGESELFVYNDFYQNKNDIAVELYAAHDTVIAPLLGALGVSYVPWPSYASRLVMELYTPSSPSSLSRFSTTRSKYIRIIYNGKIINIDEVSNIGKKSQGNKSRDETFKCEDMPYNGRIDMDGLMNLECFERYIETRILNEYQVQSEKDACAAV